MPQLSIHSPLGDLAIAEEEGAIVALDWGWGAAQDETPLLLRARDQLQAYFDGALTTFELPLAPQGSAFQRRVWAVLCEIPYGKTVSYGALSIQLKTSPRAVGLACGANPVPIIIPCHRVLAQDGGIGGYSGQGGTETKRSLLALEGTPGFEPDLFS